MHSLSTTSRCSSKKASRLPFEKTIEKSNKLSIKFIPLEACEHFIDITDNEKSITSKLINYIIPFIVIYLFVFNFCQRFSLEV